MPDRFCIHNDVSIPSIRFLRAVVRRMLGKQAKKQSAAASALLHKRKYGIARQMQEMFLEIPCVLCGSDVSDTDFIHVPAPLCVSGKRGSGAAGRVPARKSNAERRHKPPFFSLLPSG